MKAGDHIAWFAVITRWGQWKRIPERLRELGVGCYIPPSYNTLVFLHTGKERALSLVNAGIVHGHFIIDHRTHTLQEYTDNITVYDPWANRDAVRREYGIEVTAEAPQDRFDAVILAVAHKEFQTLDVRSFLKENGIVYDVKGVLPREVIDARL